MSGKRSFWTGITAAIVLGLAFGRIWFASFDDFAVYWRAGKEALHGLSVYTEPGHYQFKYAPFTALSLGWLHAAILKIMSWIGISNEGFRPHGSPEGMLVSQASRWVANLLYWTFLSAWTLWFIRLSGSQRPSSLQWKHLALVMILLLQSLSEELNLGQVNFIPIILLVLVLTQLDASSSARQTFLCSLALAIAVDFKLFAFIVFPLLAFRGRWGWIIGSVIAIAVSNLVLPGILQGWPHAVSEFQAWAVTLTHSSDQLLYSGHNIAWIGTLGKATGNPTLAKFTWMALILLFVVLQFRIRNRNAEAQIAWNFAAILVLNPLTWNYWMLFLAPLLFQILGFYAEAIERSPRRFAWIFLALWIPFNMIFSPWSRNWLEPLMILGLTAFWYTVQERGVRGQV